MAPHKSKEVPSCMPMPSKMCLTKRYPIHWQDEEEVHNFVRRLGPSTGECMAIKTACEEMGIKVIKVSRVENGVQAKKYSFKMEEMQHANAEFKANERYLFHGMRSETLTAILKDGLDMRHCKGRNNFGRNAVYFSGHPRKAMSYVHSGISTGEILLCRVMLGKVKEYEGSKSDPELIKEPEGFDSVKGNPNGYDEYVVYENQRALVEYIIEFDNKRLLAQRRKKGRARRSSVDGAASDGESGSGGSGCESSTESEEEVKPEEQEEKEEVKQDDGLPPLPTKKQIKAVRDEYMRQLIEKLKTTPLSIQQQALLYSTFKETYDDPPKEPQEEPTVPAEAEAKAES